MDWGDNVVSANIYREAPPTGEEYEFLGKRDDEVIFGTLLGQLQATAAVAFCWYKGSDPARVRLAANTRKS